LQIISLAALVNINNGVAWCESAPNSPVRI
jgi:hypothetical protein